eukprot:scaffold10_cov257-Pinguiococcus_pyrenoidosus.AAC.11
MERQRCVFDPVATELFPSKLLQSVPLGVLPVGEAALLVRLGRLFQEIVGQRLCLRPVLCHVHLRAAYQVEVEHSHPCLLNAIPRGNCPMISHDQRVRILPKVSRNPGSFVMVIRHAFKVVVGNLAVEPRPVLREELDPLRQARNEYAGFTMCVHDGLYVRPTAVDRPVDHVASGVHNVVALNQILGPHAGIVAIPRGHQELRRSRCSADIGVSLSLSLSLGLTSSFCAGCRRLDGDLGHSGGDVIPHEFVEAVVAREAVGSRQVISNGLDRRPDAGKPGHGPHERDARLFGAWPSFKMDTSGNRICPPQDAGSIQPATLLLECLRAFGGFDLGGLLWGSLIWVDCFGWIALGGLLWALAPVVECVVRHDGSHRQGYAAKRWLRGLRQSSGDNHPAVCARR